MEHAMSEHLTVLKWLIPAIYAVIALQFGNSALKATNLKRKLACLFLVMIFVACGFSGYLAVVISAPMWVVDLSHVILALSGIAFILTNQAANVIRDD